MMSYKSALIIRLNFAQPRLSRMSLWLTLRSLLYVSNRPSVSLLVLRRGTMTVKFRLMSPTGCQDVGFEEREPDLET